MSLIAFGVFAAFSSFACGQALITSINPNQGPIAGGTTVTLTGSGFSGTTLLLDYQQITPQSASSTRMVFVTPPHDSGIVNVELSGNGPNAFAEFTYMPPSLASLPTGDITTVMGIGHFRGDGRLGTNAMVDGGAMGMTLGADGSIYFSEPNQNLIRRVRPDGIVERVAGTANTCCNLGDGGAALQAVLGHPRGVALDSGGNLFFADSIYTNAVRRVDANTGIITTVVGGQTAGFSGDGGQAISAQLNDPLQVAFDGLGNLYILDWGNVRIRKVNTSGIISTIAGTGTAGYSGDGGPATQATFNIGGDDSGGLAADAGGDVFLADNQNGRVRRIDAQTGIITTFVNGVGPADAVAVDSSGNVYVGDNNYGSSQGRILEFSASGQLLQSWGRGQGFSADGSAAASAAMGFIQRIAIDSSGNVLFAEYDSNRIRRINIGTGLLETLAGMGPHIIGETASATATPVNDPGTGLAFAADGDLLTAEGYNLRARQMSPSGTVSDFAGNGFITWDTYPSQAPALQIHLYPTGIGAAPNGDVYIVSVDGAPLVRVDPQGNLYAAVPNGGFSGDGGPAASAALNPSQYSQVTVDSQGNVLVADSGNDRIRRIDAAMGVISTVAGNGTKSDCGDGGPAVNACLDNPVGVAVDTDGTIFVSENDGSNDRIRKIGPGGIISTFATLSTGVGQLALNQAHNLFVAPYRIEPNGHAFQFVPTSGTPTGLGDGGPASAATVNTGGVAGIAVDNQGDLIFSDDANLRIRAIRYGAVISEPGSTVTASAGAAQSAPEGGAFATALQATVNSPGGTSENGIRVDFAAPATGPSCIFPNGQSTYSALTGLNGIASAPCVADNQTGSYSVTATPLALGSSVSFALTNSAAPVVNLSATALTFVSETVGTSSAGQSASVTNAGSANLTFSAGAATISGTNSADFVLTSDGCSGQILAPGGTCSVSVTFKPSVAGSETATLDFADNAANTPQAVSLSGTGADFSLAVASGSSSSASISPGATATYSVSVSPLGGFNQAVALTCTGAPSLATCTVSAGSVTPNGTSPQTVTVSVGTTASRASLAGSKKPWLPPPMEWLGIAFGLLAPVLLAGSKRQCAPSPTRVRTSLAGVLLLAAAAAGCGGGGNSSPPPNPGTPTGSYTLTVTGTSGNLTHSTKLTLTVN